MEPLRPTSEPRRLAGQLSDTVPACDDLEATGVTRPIGWHQPELFRVLAAGAVTRSAKRPATARATLVTSSRD